MPFISKALSLSLLLFAAAGASASTLECSGLGETLQSKKQIPITKAQVTLDKLKSGQDLVLDFLGVVVFRVIYDDGTFVARFSVEDGELPPDKRSKSFDSFSKLNGLKTWLDFDVNDGNTGKSYWRMHVKCAVREK